MQYLASLKQAGLAKGHKFEQYMYPYLAYGFFSKLYYIST